MMRRRRGWHAHQTRRLGGANPLKLVATAVAVLTGGVIAVAVAGAVIAVLTAIGTAFASAGGLLVYGWIIAGVLIYRALQRRWRRDEDDVDDDWREEMRERARERNERLQERLVQVRKRATRVSERQGRAVPVDVQTPDERREASEEGTEQPSTGVAAVAVIAGLLLAVAASVGLGQTSLSPLLSAVLPPVIGGVVGLGTYGILNRYVMPPPPGEKPPSREVRAQTGRIRRKAAKVRREAAETGGVFGDLEWQSGELADRAGELCERLMELRRVAREVRREMGGADGHDADEAAASSAQKRLDALMTRNRDAQRRCLSQLERIEDLLDIARLELACPADGSHVEEQQTTIVREFETELTAARQALDEVQTAKA